MQGTTLYYDTDGVCIHVVDRHVTTIVLTAPPGTQTMGTQIISVLIPTGRDSPDTAAMDPVEFDPRLLATNREMQVAPQLDFAPAADRGVTDAMPVDAATVAAAQAGRIVRLLAVSSLTDTTADNEKVIVFHAALQADGLKGNRIVMKVRPTLLDGGPIKAAPGTPESLVLPDGMLLLRLEDTVTFDAAAWSNWRGFIAHRWIALGPGTHELLLHISVTCADASARSLLSYKLVLP